ncbi:unnamed protein product [Cyprideis torosa]|uniref:Thymidylate synthase n=1 Tax=Cyprideis torosa TaxID=163714 RepID=A0A7R8WR36_9CRUS|nr:unnamed protein product [Cyprideis torosa]CAG0903198.1 unnamed protein product [Cyprideis torosa]
MQQYLDLAKHVMTHGVDKEDRTGVGTRSVFGYQCRFDLSEGFPLVTTKKLHLKSIIYELLWFIKGDTNIKYLNDHGVSIWDEWADDSGDLGPVYGRQWRSWPSEQGTVDQLLNVIEQIKTQPDSRRLMVSAWNVGEIPKMALAPCHTMFQFYVADGKLSLQLYQRSADIFLGVPFNIASYALLLMMVAQVCDLKVGSFVHTFGDAHIYTNHFDQINLQLSREPRALPQMKINPSKPLPNRKHLILSRSADFVFDHPQVLILKDLDAFWDGGYLNENRVCVIGGGEIYAQMMPFADRLEITHLHDHLDGDTFFPEIDPKIWHCTRELYHPIDERHAIDFTFCTYDRLKND